MRSWLSRIAYLAFPAWYLPPLDLESRQGRAWAIYFSLFGLGMATIAPDYALLGWGIAIGATVVSTLLFYRSWPLWDLLVWASHLDYGPTEEELDANWEATTEACAALCRRRFQEARDALNRVVNPDPWRETVVRYYGCLVDLETYRSPDVAGLTHRVATLEPGPRAKMARVFQGLVESGVADAANRNWRAPLLECKRELGVRRSMRRALWPMEFAYILVIAMMILAAAIPILR